MLSSAAGPMRVEPKGPTLLVASRSPLGPFLGGGGAAAQRDAPQPDAVSPAFWRALNAEPVRRNTSHVACSLGLPFPKGGVSRGRSPMRGEFQGSPHSPPLFLWAGAKQRASDAQQVDAVVPSPPPPDQELQTPN